WMASTSGPPNLVMTTAFMLKTIVVERDLLDLGRRKASHEGHEGLTKKLRATSCPLGERHCAVLRFATCRRNDVVHAQVFHQLSVFVVGMAEKDKRHAHFR